MWCLILGLRLLLNGEVPPETWDVLMTHNRFELDIEPGSESYKLQDDWLTKEELAEKKAKAQVQQADLHPQPKIKQEGMMKQEGATKVKNFPNVRKITSRNTTFSEHSENLENVQSSDNGIQEGAIGLPEQSRMDSERNSTRQGTLRTDRPVDGPIASLRLNPRRRAQRQVMNIGDTNVKSYFAAVDRMQELRAENQNTQRFALAVFYSQIMDPEEGFIDTSGPDILLRT